MHKSIREVGLGKGYISSHSVDEVPALITKVSRRDTSYFTKHRHTLEDHHTVFATHLSTVSSIGSLSDYLLGSTVRAPYTFELFIGKSKFQRFKVSRSEDQLDPPHQGFSLEFSCASRPLEWKVEGPVEKGVGTWVFGALAGL